MYIRKCRVFGAQSTNPKILVMFAQVRMLAMRKLVLVVPVPEFTGCCQMGTYVIWTEFAKNAIPLGSTRYRERRVQRVSAGRGA